MHSSGIMDKIVFVTFCILMALRRAKSVELEYQIDEEGPPDTFVGNVKADYDLRSTMTSLDYDSLVYRILTAGNEHASLFKIGEKDGILYTAARIDRDTIPDCMITSVCVLTLDIAIQTKIGAFFRKISIDVTINDINDINPWFAATTDKVEFSESSVLGTYATIDGAKDGDVGQFSVQNYYIAMSDAPFDVTLEKYVDGRTVVKIVVTGPLDREATDFYQIHVIAEDGGNPKLTGELTVNVTILDFNDHKPTFDVPFYNVTIPEDHPLNVSFLTVHASDADLDVNAEIEYGLSGRSFNLKDAVTDVFAINRMTGELTVIGKLESTSDEPVKIYVEAADKGKQPMVEQVLVYIYVEDTSNNAPEIKVNILSGDEQAAVSEYARVGAVVAFIAVSDVDSGRNGKVDCITTSDYFGMERLAENEYKVTVSRALNRELRDVHDVTVICRDDGTPPLNSTADFSVTVWDENDNPPRFSQNTYFIKAEENNQIGDVVARVFADDVDVGDNGKVTYTLFNTSGYDFWIDHASGEIRANFILDRENITDVTIVVKATDNGKPPMSSTSTLKLIITDQNDHAPAFTQSSYRFFVHEGINLNSTIDQLIATDKDNGENGSVTFSFDTIPASNFPFVLFSDGTIKMIRSLDRETKSRYEFVVIASDRGLPPLSSSATVTVIVLDINDHEPRFVFPNNVNNTVQVSLESELDKVTITVKAIDFDEGVNKDITYSIIDNNFTDMFQIGNEADSGVIRISRFPGRKDPLKYNLMIKAQDHGNVSSLYSVQTLTIIFTSESDGEPSNFILAVSFGCATVFLSVAIIVTICLIRRRDRNTCNEFTDCSKIDFQIDRDHVIKQNVTVSDTTTVSQESVKDGGFNCDPDSTWNSEHWKPAMNSSFLNPDLSEMTGNKTCQNSCQSPTQEHVTPYDPCYQKLDPAALQLHRSLLKAHVQSFKVCDRGHVDDNGSEASAETNTVDSGKGSSVSDVMSPLSRDLDPGKTVTFAEQPMLYRFLQGAQYQRDKIIPTIPENCDILQQDDGNGSDSEKYDDDFIDNDRSKTDGVDTQCGERLGYVFANGEKATCRNYNHNLNGTGNERRDAFVGNNGKDKRNNACNKRLSSDENDFVRRNRDFIRAPLCNKTNNRNFHSRENSASIPSLYSDSQSDGLRKSNDRLQSPSIHSSGRRTLTSNERRPTRSPSVPYEGLRKTTEHIRCPSAPYTPSHPSAYNKSQSQTLAGQLSHNSDHGSEMWSSCYDEDDTTTEGSYIVDQLDSPKHAQHSPSRAFNLAPNEAYC